jgi:hypothetical protein
MKIHFVFFVSLLEFKLCKNNLKGNFVFFICANGKLYNAYTLHLCNVYSNWWSFPHWWWIAHGNNNFLKISMLTSNGSGSMIARWFPFNSHNLQGNVMTNVGNMAPLLTKSMTSWKVDLRINPSTQCLWIAISIYKKIYSQKPKNKTQTLSTNP